MHRFPSMSSIRSAVRSRNSNRCSMSTKPHKSLRTIDEMPHKKSLPIIGTKFDLFSAGGGKNLHKYIDMRHKQLGPIFYERLTGKTKLVFISDPTHMKSLFLNLEGKYPAHILPEPWVLYEKLYGSKRGLFFMDGEDWLINRRIMNKHLLREDSDVWLRAPIRTAVFHFICNWKLRAQSGNFSPNLESEFYRFSTDVILAVLQGNSALLKPTPEYEMLLLLFSEAVKKIFSTTTKLYALPVEFCQRWNLKVWRNFKQSVDDSISIAQKIVYEMLHTKDAGDGLVKRLKDENMSDELITRIVADFVIAAGDTTAYTSLWILFLLSKNTEILTEMNDNDQYVKNVVKEAMRLYPVAPFLTRILPKQCVLGPYLLEEGIHFQTPVIASIYTSGRDEQNFSKADQFLPYRWDRNDQRKKDLVNHVPSATLPFAFGARSCIGKKMAMLQMTELISQIVKNFDLKSMNNSDVDAVTSQVLVPNKDIKVLILPRSISK
uniref:Cholesterol side-chain cleavage enzyme, mitochondrial n=1 Tax=Bombyx mori TaxID=7091 RepID=L0N747_BOMMO|nr:cytochrome P450 [Bombyx mori]